jgi:NADPH-dependent 2,4-dienoyl-CoA reductase/sulfur reductase-like enzyme
MPYYIGDVIQDAKNLIARTPEQFAKTGIDVRLHTKVEEIDTEKGVVRISGGEIMPYDTLVMGTGSKAFMPDIQGLDLAGVFTLKNLTDAIGIKSYIREHRCRKAIIVGAGFIAMEMSEALRKLDLETAVVYRGDRPVRRWDPEFSEMIREELVRHDVDFITHVIPTSIERGSDGAGLRMHTNNGVLEADIIVFGLGIRPNTKLAREIGLAIGDTCAVKVNFAQKTSRDEIYAVGDCCEVFNRVSGQWVYTPLGDIANKQGRIAGANIGGHAMSFAGMVGAQSFKVFALDVAVAGLSEDEARANGFHPVSTIVSGSPIARSLGKGETLRLKLIADAYSGRLLGAEAVGNGGAVSRINTLAACLWSGMGLDEIGYLDLAYSPPFGGPWDLVHIAAQSLRRKL